MKNWTLGYWFRRNILNDRTSALLKSEVFVNNGIVFYFKCYSIFYFFFWNYPKHYTLLMVLSSITPSPHFHFVKLKYLIFYLFCLLGISVFFFLAIKTQPSSFHVELLSNLKYDPYSLHPPLNQYHKWRAFSWHWNTHLNAIKDHKE